MKVGSETTRLIVLRGNSGSGKSSIAQHLRACYGRGLALVGQDNIRRTVLRERDVPDAANIGLIDTVTRYALNHGYHVIVEGIFHASRYDPMLRTLRHDHLGQTHCYYLDVPFEETLRRHATRPQAYEFGAQEMREWYTPLDLLPGGYEQIIEPHTTLDETVQQILNDTHLDIST